MILPPARPWRCRGMATTTTSASPTLLRRRRRWRRRPSRAPSASRPPSTRTKGSGSGSSSRETWTSGVSMDSSLSSSVNGSKPSRDRALLQLLRPLATILESRGVTEVTINRPGEAWAKTVEGWRRDQVAELTESYLESLATAMIVYNGLAPASIVSVVLPGGQRGQIVRPPACIRGAPSLFVRENREGG